MRNFDRTQSASAASTCKVSFGLRANNLEAHWCACIVVGMEHITTTTKVETYNFMSNLPARILVQSMAFPSKHSSGFTQSGFVAWKFDGLNAVSPKVWGETSKSAVSNLLVSHP